MLKTKKPVRNLIIKIKILKLEFDMYRKIISLLLQ